MDPEKKTVVTEKGGRWSNVAVCGDAVTFQ